MAMTERDRFAILGCHRSGTSLLARLLIAAGCYAGPPHRFRSPDQLNPVGYLEHRAVHGLDRRLLAAVGAGLARPTPALDGIPVDVVDRYRAPMERVVAELEPRRPWLMKDPQLCFTLPAWRRVVPELTCLLALRHPLEVARSLERVAQGMTMELGLAEWEAYTVGAVNSSAGCTRALVDHRELLADPEATLVRLHEEVGLDVTRALAVVHDMVQPDLHRARVGEIDGRDLPRAVAALYERLSADGLPEAGERLELSERSREVIDRHTGTGPANSTGDRTVAIVVDGRLDPTGGRATAMIRRTWGSHDLARADVFYCFADPISVEASRDLRGFLPGGSPSLTEGAVFGRGPVIVAGCGDESDPKSGLLKWLLALSHLVDAGRHDAYLLVDPFTHVDLERLLEHLDVVTSRTGIEWAVLDSPIGEPDAAAMMISRAVAERLVSDAADVIAWAGSGGFSEAIRDWVGSAMPDVTVAGLAGGLADLRRRGYLDQGQQAGAICHRFAPDRVHELEWFHDRHNPHLDPGFAVAGTRNEAANDLIFVQIPSYRDPELPGTVRSLLENAADARRLRIGVCWQYDEWTATDLDPWIDDWRFRIDEVHYPQSRGCSWARARVNQLYDGEGYTLQIDSHMRFAERWDERLVEMLEGIDSPKPLLTTYPPGYRYDDDGVETRNLTTGIQRVGVRELGTDLTSVQVGEMAPDPRRPGPSRHLAGGYVFAHGQFVVDVPSDPGTYFNGEELALAARAFTHGYDLYYPNENLVWHLYYHPAPKHWADSRTWPKLQSHAVDRLRILLTGDHAALGRHGLGTVRSISDYERYAGLDFRAARHGLATPKLIESHVMVDLGALGIESRPDYERFRIRLHDEQCRIVHRVDVVDPVILRGDVTTVMVDALVPEPVATYSVRAAHAGGWTESITRPAGPVVGHRATKSP